MRKFLLSFSFLALLATQAQAQDTLQVMVYNLLNFSDTSAYRVQYLRKIVNHVKPDVFLVNELITDSAARIILNQTLNINGTTKYQKAVYTSGFDTNNMLFYNTDKVALKSQETFYTTPRWTNGYKLYYKDPNLAQHNDTVYLNMYEAHLKASTGSSNEQNRLHQCTTIRNLFDARTNIKNYFFTGDFNFYKSSEPGYQKLLSPGPCQFLDPINMPGNWNNNASFAAIHTQSPRTTQFGGGANGGMDDRFDFILTTADVLAGNNGAKYVPGSYKAFGNDGQHFNMAINDLPVNTSAPDSVIYALWRMADHLPVLMKVVVDRTLITGFSPALATAGFNFFAQTINPTHISLSMELPKRLEFFVVNATGQVLQHEVIRPGSEPAMALNKLPNGFYILKLTDGVIQRTQKIIIAN